MESISKESNSRQVHDREQLGQVLDIIGMNNKRLLVVSRLGKHNDQQTRPIKLILPNSSDSQDMIHAAREVKPELNGRKIYFNPDLSEQERIKRKQYTEYKRSCDNGTQVLPFGVWSRKKKE